MTPGLSRRSLFQALAVQALGSGDALNQAKVHRSPKPLDPSAVTHLWPSFLGPTHDGISTETHLSRELPPPLVWELSKGTGYTSPAIAEDRLVFFHRVGDNERIDCLHPETGAHWWSYQYPTKYQDRYGYNNGPRSSPVIGDTRVFCIGAEGKTHCLNLLTGELLWQLDLRATYDLSQEFFGTSSTPLLWRDTLVVNGTRTCNERS